MSTRHAKSSYAPLTATEMQWDRVYLLTWIACAVIGSVLTILSINGNGPTPDIGLTFDSGREYSVHEAKLTWLVVIAAGISFAVNFYRWFKHTRAESVMLVYYTTPVVTSLLVVDVLALSRVHEGHTLVLGAVLAFMVSLTETTGVYLPKGGVFVAVWLQAAAAAGWVALLEVAWYTAAWSEHHLGGITPNYVIPLLVVVTALLVLTKVAHLIILYGTRAATHPVRCEAVLCGLHVALLAVVGFVPML